LRLLQAPLSTNPDALRIPTVEILLDLEPEELGARMLPILKRRAEEQREPKGVCLDIDITVIANGLLETGLSELTPRRLEAKAAIVEAWA
jgi:hypothetical protein